MELTERQKRFADHFIETGNATQAAIAAGYSVKTAREMGYENLTKPHIRDYVDARIAEKDSLQIAKQDEVLQFLSSVMRGEKVEQIPLGLGGGEQKLVDKELDGKDRVKAAELLGKRYGLWVERQKIEGEVVVFSGEDDLLE